MGPTETRRRRLEGAVTTIYSIFLSWRNGAAITTVDHADIRGLATACLAFVVELPLAKVGSSADWRDPIVQPRVLRPWPRPPFQETGKTDYSLLMLQSPQYGQWPI
jgi:hypothetical protein